MTRETIDGIDISQVQGLPKWDAVYGAGFRFAFLKATEGSKYVDPYFLKNSAAAQAAGVIVGPYAYVRPGQDPKVQAKLLYNTAYAGKCHGVGGLPPVIDIETRGQMSLGDAVEFWKAITDETEALFQKKPILYTYTYFWKQAMYEMPSLAADSWWSEHPLWHAFYGPKMAPWYPKGQEPPELKPWPEATFWQYSGNGGAKVPGVAGDCDRNFFFGSIEELRAYAGIFPPDPVKSAA